MKIESYKRNRTRERVEMGGGVILGPTSLLEIIRQAERPAPVDPENPPLPGGLPNLSAPLIHMESNGIAWWMGTRPLCQVTWGRHGERSGYASAKGKQRKFVDTVMRVADGSTLPAWVCDETAGMGSQVFRLPWPLDNRDEAMRWQAAGLTHAESEKYWGRFLQWAGAGSLEAVQAVRERWRVLASSRDAIPKPWPDGVRIESPKPEHVAGVTWTWGELCAAVDGLKTVETERVNAAAGEMEGLRGELAKLRGDLEMERTRRANLEERVLRQARSVDDLRGQIEALRALV